jgi:hypothetical protein
MQIVLENLRSSIWNLVRCENGGVIGKCCCETIVIVTSIEVYTGFMMNIDT